MRYWWVNQNQTFAAEHDGGYLWSPKRNKNGARNQFYENMREVSPGDLIVSFRGTRIVAVSIARSYGYDCPRPAEFGTVGEQWDDMGWRVDAEYTLSQHPIRPKDHMDVLRPLLPDKYSPLQASGDGLQSVYLAELPQSMADALLELMRAAGDRIPTSTTSSQSAPQQPDEMVRALEDKAEQMLESSQIESTEKEALVKARRGQGLFRSRLESFEPRCRVSGVADPTFLIASHIKPWRYADNTERLDGENGLLLAPNIDWLFDRGFISFNDDGTLIVSPVLSADTAQLLGVPTAHPFETGGFTDRQRVYLAYHRHHILKRVE